MNDEHEIESLLEQAPRPFVDEGPHRARLKADLLSEMTRRLEKEEAKMRTWTWKTKLAWACSFGILAAATSWGAVEAYQQWFVVHEEILPPTTATLPNGGQQITVGSKTAVVVGSDENVKTQEDADRQYKAVQDLIALGKYRLLKETTTKEGVKVYVYEFILSDGTRVKHGQNWPLGTKPPQLNDHQEELQRLIAEGKGELIKVDESARGTKVYLYRFKFADGTSTTFGSNVPLEPKKP